MYAYAGKYDSCFIMLSRNTYAYKYQIIHRVYYDSDIIFTFTQKLLLVSSK